MLRDYDVFPKLIDGNFNILQHFIFLCLNFHASAISFEEAASDNVKYKSILKHRVRGHKPAYLTIL